MKSVSIVGYALAPWVGGWMARELMVDNVGHRASLIIYCVFAGSSGALAFLLPDTVGFRLPATFEDVRDIKR